MCDGGILGGAKKPSAPVITKAPEPTVAATAPPAEEVAEAPVVNEGSKRQDAADAQRKGTSALRINLNLGGGMGGSASGNGRSGGLSIPR